MTASWDYYHWGCQFCTPAYATVSISGSNGFSQSGSAPAGSTGGYWSWYDSNPSAGSTIYTVDVTVTWYDEAGYSTETDSSWTEIFEAQPPPPVISGPTTVWWFSGENTAGYDTAITLTSDAGASTEWSIIAGQNLVNMSATSGESITLTSTGSAFSEAADDIRIVATANGQSSSEFAITSRTPFSLEPVTATYECDGTYGYYAKVLYVIKDQLTADLPNNVALNEQWTTNVVTDYSGTNWRRADAVGFTSHDGPAFEDGMYGEAPGLPAVPQPTCDGNSQPINHWGQAWRIGSQSIGAGKLVQTNTLQKLLGRAIHTNIVSPPQ